MVRALATDPDCPVVFWFRVGTSAATIDRKTGVPETPLGEAKKRFEVCEAQAAVKVPAAVTGEFVTVKSLGIESPTEVTVPAPATADHTKAEPFHFKKVSVTVGTETNPVVLAAVW